MATPKVYVLCDTNCKWESMTKEQILSAIMQAVNEGTISNIDAGFITKIKEQNTGKNFKIWTGTYAEYLAIPTANIDEDCLYIITDDTDLEDIKRRLNALEENIEQGGSGFLGAHADTVTIKDVGNNNFLDVLVGDTVTGEVFALSDFGVYYDTSTKKLCGKIINADHADKADEADHADKADEATKASYLEDENGIKFGRKELYKYSNSSNNGRGKQLPKDGAVASFNITDVINKFIVVEFEIVTGATYGSQTICKVRTPAFNPKGAQKQTVTFSYGFPIYSDISVKFRCGSSNVLSINRSGGSTADTGEEIYVNAIYEEL